MNVVPLPGNNDDPTFDDFWILWPKRVAKKKATEAWRKIRPERRVEVIVALVEWRAYWIDRGEMEFVPHPATWLNGERWEDDLPRDWGKSGRSKIAVDQNRVWQQKVEAEKQAAVPMPAHVRELIEKLKRK